MFQKLPTSDSIQPIVNSIVERIMSERSLRSKERAETETEEPRSRKKKSKKNKKKKKNKENKRSAEFYKSVASKLNPHRNSICIQEDFDFSYSEHEEETSDEMREHQDFEAAFGPNEMRCLALVSHNEMKLTMKNFVECHKHVLKKFRLTGTASTMKMLTEVFYNEPDVVFGPTCSSGPLGGDAELVALMTTGELGGILFFQDPMTAHPHQADIDCLNRQAMVHNSVIATTPTTAMAIMQVFRIALEGKGMAELIPSFFFSLQSPSVAAYKTAQTKIVESISMSEHSTSTHWNSLREAYNNNPPNMVKRRSVSDLSVTSILVDSCIDQSARTTTSLSSRISCLPICNDDEWI